MIYLVILATLGGFWMGYPIGMVGAIASNIYFREYFGHPSDVAIESLAAVLYSAAAIGCFAFGELADILGRRVCIKCMASLLVASSMMQALPLVLPTPLYVIHIGRGIMGLGFGGVYGTLSVYVAEVAPLPMRGFLEAYLELLSYVGLLAGYVACYALLPNNYYGWMHCLASQLPFSLLFLALALTCPESPRWLMMNGDSEGAKRELINLHGDTGTVFEDELDALVSYSRPQSIAPWSEVLSFTTEWPSILAIVMIIHTNTDGSDVIGTFMPEIFAEGRDGVKNESEDLLLTVWCGIIPVVASLIPTFGIDRLGRRIFLVVGPTLCTLAFALLAVGYAKTSTSSTERSLLHVGPVFLFQFGCGMWTACANLQPSEMLHTRVRSKVVGVAWALAWVVDYMIVGTFLSMKNTFGVSGTFFFYFVLNATISGFMINYIPETLGNELDSDVQRGSFRRSVGYGTDAPEACAENPQLCQDNPQA